MGIIYTRRAPRRYRLSTVKDEGPTYDIVFYVRTDTPNPILVEVRDAPGIKIGDTFQDAGADFVICKSIDVTAADDSGMLYEVSCRFDPLRPEEGSGGGENGGQTGAPPIPIWSASGSTSVIPVYKDVDDVMITNSAGDPLEGLEKEKSEFTLVLTKPYRMHNEWIAIARGYTDTVNAAAWNGGQAETWLCRFRSASVERTDGLVYWSTQWEFAYRAENWRLKPWDIGFHQLDGEGGGDYAKKSIVGADGKSVKQPVALAGGTPLPAGEPPVVIRDGDGAKVYEQTDFGSAFGEVFTPTF